MRHGHDVLGGIDGDIHERTAVVGHDRFSGSRDICSDKHVIEQASVVAHHGIVTGHGEPMHITVAHHDTVGETYRSRVAPRCRGDFKAVEQGHAVEGFTSRNHTSDNGARRRRCQQAGTGGSYIGNGHLGRHVGSGHRIGVIRLHAAINRHTVMQGDLLVGATALDKDGSRLTGNVAGGHIHGTQVDGFLQTALSKSPLPRRSIAVDGFSRLHIEYRIETLVVLVCAPVDVFVIDTEVIQRNVITRRIICGQTQGGAVKHGVALVEQNGRRPYVEIAQRHIAIKGILKIGTRNDVGVLLREVVVVLAGLRKCRGGEVLYGIVCDIFGLDRRIASRFHGQ